MAQSDSNAGQFTLGLEVLKFSSEVSHLPAAPLSWNRFGVMSYWALTILDQILDHILGQLLDQILDQILNQPHDHMLDQEVMHSV